MKLSYRFGEDDNRIRVLEPDSQGLYRVPLSDRYLLPGVEIETRLKALGLEYVSRPPDQFYELWRLRTVETPAPIIPSNTDVYINGNLQR